MKKKTAIITLTAAVLIALISVQWQRADAYRGRYSGQSGVPQGTIVLWSGATAPSGWAICDGNNGTPDLRNLWVVGAGDTYALDATGGSLTTSSEAVPHDTGDDLAAGGDFNSQCDTHSHTILPPYYALYYIMKL